MLCAYLTIPGAFRSGIFTTPFKENIDKLELVQQETRRRENKETMYGVSEIVWPGKETSRAHRYHLPKMSRRP